MYCLFKVSSEMIQLYIHMYPLCMCVCVCVQLCLTLCDPMGCSPPGSSVHGIFQARILEWVAISSSRENPNQGIEPRSLCLLHW